MSLDLFANSSRSAHELIPMPIDSAFLGLPSDRLFPDAKFLRCIDRPEITENALVPLRQLFPVASVSMDDHPLF